jgi:16S rRNA G1207 methylase RsmC
MEEDFRPISEAVNWGDIKTVLDIGCGVGGIDVLIWKQCAPMITLMDYDKTAETLRYGLQSSGEPYNSMTATIDMMKANGVKGFTVVTVENNDQTRIIGKFDLILSCLSWGYHYPVSTYLYQAKHALNPSGAIIIDIRENTRDQWQELVEANFEEWEVIARGNKREKVVIWGPKV